MTEVHHTKQLIGPVKWTFDFDVCFMIEVETTSILKHLPRGVYAAEVRPGISLMAFSVHQFRDGAVGETMPKTIVEATASIVVQPNLSIPMALPRLAMYVIYVASTSPEFDRYAQNVDKMPIYDSPNLKCVIREDLSVSVSDDNGPMFELKNTSPNIAFKKSELIGQAFTYANGKELFCTPFRWQGRLWEHQDRSQGFGKIYNHPSLGGINVNEAQQTCYLQMFAPLHEEGTITYWRPVSIY